MRTSEQPKDVSKLLQAAGHGKLDLVNDLLTQGLPVNATNHVGCTALMSASASYRADVVLFLLRSGADVAVRTTDGQTALHTAVGSSPSMPDKQKECVRMLLEHGAEIDAQDKNGISPLMNAAWFGCTLAVSELLRHGASVSLRNNQGRTAEDLARNKNQPEVIRILTGLP
jgi:ankyrin repeat protein